MIVSMKNKCPLPLAIITFVSLSSVLVAEITDKKKARPRKPNPSLAPVEDVAGLPRVLLIGDSISMGYTLPVRDLLQGKANVHRPPANCGPTTLGLKHIDTWLQSGGAGKKWDVIHFNWGLHDLKFMGPNGENLANPDAPDSRQQVPPEQYEANLRKLVAILKKTGATLIWRNTTPVPEGAKGRLVGHSKLYNEIAARIMEENGIATDDLYGLSMKNPSWMREANVHYTPEGSAGLAKQVAATIQKALP